jgi:hypothetical protein
MTISDLMLFTINQNKQRLSAKRLTNLYVVYFQVFMRINYSDNTIKEIYVRIIDDKHIEMIFYINGNFNYKLAEKTLRDFKLNVERIEFDYFFVKNEKPPDSSHFKIK